MLKLAKTIDPKKIARTTNRNYLSVRNIYFIPKQKKKH